MKIRKLFSLFSKEHENQTDIDMTNVVNSMFLCKPLYDKLKINCHPDKFVDEDQKLIAENLFQELQKHRYNYEKMREIELLVDNIGIKKEK